MTFQVTTGESAPARKPHEREVAYDENDVNQERQVGQHPGKRRSTISADFSSEKVVRGTEEDAANGSVAAASVGMADRFKND